MYMVEVLPQCTFLTLAPNPELTHGGERTNACWMLDRNQADGQSEVGKELTYWTHSLVHSNVLAKVMREAANAPRCCFSRMYLT